MATSPLVPDLSGPLTTLLQTFGTRQSRAADRAARERAESEQGAIDILTGGIVEEQPEAAAVPGAIDERGALGRPTAKQKQDALVRLASLNPQAANAIRQSLERGDKLDLAETARKTEAGTRQALLISRQPDFAGKQRALVTAAQEASARGEDVSRFVELSNLSEPQLDLELEKMVIQGADLKTLTGEFLAEEQVATAKTAIGKVTEDLRNGLITDEQADAIIAKETQTPQGRQSLTEKLAEERAVTLQDIELRKNDPVEQLKLEQLEQNVAAKAAAIQANKETLTKAQGLKSTTKRLIDELLEDKDAIRAVVGPADQLAFTFLPSSLRAETKINQISSILTADNLNLMTGVLSETDIRILAAVAGGGLNVGGDDEAFIKELERMSKSLSGEAPKPVATTTEGNTIGRFKVKVK